METMTLEQVTIELKRLSENVADLRDELRRNLQSINPARVEYPTDHPHIYTSPTMHRGEPTIRGTAISVRTIVERTRLGDSPEEILHGYPHLNLAQVYDALSYYYDHKEQIDRYSRENEEALWQLPSRDSLSPSTQTKI